MTSPVVDTTQSSGTVTLKFKRWLNVDESLAVRIHVFDGSSWISIFGNAANLTANAWSAQAIDVTAYKNENFQVRLDRNWHGAGLWMEY